MSEFKGTKGEWEVVNLYGFTEIKLKGQFVGQICMLPYTDAEFKKAVNSREENLANAKLIAAAPDLLEALQKIASNSNDHAMIRIAIKAINKALK